MLPLLVFFLDFCVTHIHVSPFGSNLIKVSLLIGLLVGMPFTYLTFLSSLTQSYISCLIYAIGPADIYCLAYQISEQASIIFDETMRQDRLPINMSVSSEPMLLPAYYKDWRMKISPLRGLWRDLGLLSEYGPQILLPVLCFSVSFHLKLSYEHGTIYICRCNKLSYPNHRLFFVTQNSILGLQSLGNFLHT